MNALLIIVGWLLSLVGVIIIGAGIAGIVKRDVVQGVITIVVGALVIAGGAIVVFS